MMKPLTGLRVIDFTAMVAGPTATRYLCDCGAEVIKIEPSDGDLMRGEDAERRLIFGQFNAGKKSVVVDLKSPEGLARIRSLVATADVVVENFQPGVMARLGLDYAALSGLQPALVYCSISGFGQEGPLSRRPAYAPVIHAHSGLDSVLGAIERPGGEPLRHNVMFADVVVGIVAFGAIQTALLHRERHGLGSYVDVSLLDATMQLLSLHYQRAQAGLGAPEASRYPPLKTRDGYVVIPLIAPRAIERVASIIGLGAEAVSISGEASVARAKVASGLETWVGGQTCEACDRIMTEAGVPCAIYRTMEDAWNDPQSISRGAFVTVTDPQGPYQILNTPFRISGVDLTADAAAPPLGADAAALFNAGDQKQP
jgi:crotonobetainyl-CoA:carnitine CoA-transferase CaiB-like acyl-CoA transferase